MTYPIAIKRYRMGRYILNVENTASASKTPYKSKFQRIKAFKRRRNMTYAGSLTKYRKSKIQKELSVILLIALIIFIANIAITELNSLNTRKFHIETINDQVAGVPEVVTSTAKSVEPERKEENLKFSSTLPVRVENPDIEEIKKYQWKHITIDEAISIVGCESDFQNVKNAISTASGKWMFTEGTWKDGVKARGLNWTLYDRFDFVKATNMAHWYIEFKGQVARWDCARILKIKSKI